MTTMTEAEQGSGGQLRYALRASLRASLLRSKREMNQGKEYLL